MKRFPARANLPRVAALASAAAVAVCGASGASAVGAAAAVSPAQPRRVEAVFLRHGIRLVDLLVYGDRDRPVIRSYAATVRGGARPVGSVLVFATVEGVARRGVGRGELLRGNVLVRFAGAAAKAIRERAAAALRALFPG